MLPLAFQHWSGFRLYLSVALRGYRLYPLRNTYIWNSSKKTNIKARISIQNN